MLRSITLLLTGLLAVTACHADDKAPAKAAAAPTQWVEGTHYFPIDPPQPTSSGDKVEVLEVFSYACVHCAHFEPYAQQLKKELPGYAAFSAMPAIFNPSWEPFARAYYAAQSLGVLDKTHQALFDALHRDREPIRDINDLAQFYARHGVEANKFLSAASSFEVESKLARSRQAVPQYGVDGTPTIIVAGKYRITGQSAGGFPQVVELTRYLVEREHAAKGKGKA